MELNPESIKAVANALAKLTDSAQELYLSDAEISEDLAEELGNMWDLCQDYISMYENYSR